MLRIETRKNEQEEQTEEELSAAKQDLEAAIGHYLRTTCAYFDIHKNVEVSHDQHYLFPVFPCTNLFHNLFPAGGVFANMGHTLRLPVPAEVPCSSGLCAAVRPVELVTARPTDSIQSAD